MSRTGVPASPSARRADSYAASAGRRRRLRGMRRAWRRAFRATGMPSVVVASPGEVVRPAGRRLLERRAPRGNHAATLIEPDVPHTTVSLRIRARDGLGAVCRSIIDEHQLKVRIRLLEQRVEGLRKKVGSVAQCHAEADQGRRIGYPTRPPLGGLRLQRAGKMTISPLFHAAGASNLVYADRAVPLRGLDVPGPKK